MNKIFFFIAAVILMSCGNSETKQQTNLSGDFKYVAYRWNDTNDSMGISLQHYLDVDTKGNYKLIQRDNSGNAKYYYGFVDNALLYSLIDFTKDSSIKNEYLSSDSFKLKAENENRYRFDYKQGDSAKVIIFIPPLAPDNLVNIQKRLDSLINAPGKKESASFNINDYLKKVIKEDTSTGMKAPPKDFFDKKVKQ